MLNAETQLLSMEILSSRIDFLRVFLISDVTRFEEQMVTGSRHYFKGKDMKVTQKKSELTSQREIQKIKIITGWSFDRTRTRNKYNSVFIFQTLNRKAKVSKGIQVHHRQSVCLRSKDTGGYCLLQEHTRQDALCAIPQNLLNQIGISKTIKMVTE